MRKYIISFLFFINASTMAEPTYIGDLAKLDYQDKQSARSKPEVPYPDVNVIEVFNVFLRAVDDGQLKLFDKTLSRDMVVPLRVEYVYTAELPYPVVKVYSELKKPMPLPTMPDANIIGVSGVMDFSGNIIETTAHCDVNK